MIAVFNIVSHMTHLPVVFVDIDVIDQPELYLITSNVKCLPTIAILAVHFVPRTSI